MVPTEYVVTMASSSIKVEPDEVRAPSSTVRGGYVGVILFVVLVEGVVPPVSVRYMEPRRKGVGGVGV
jgi:cation transporter-like permease